MMETKEPIDRRSFAAGDLVLRCEPFVWVLESDEYQARCAYCLRQSEELRTCSRCRLHRYCSVTCQSTDWKLEHKLECTLLKTATDSTNGTEHDIIVHSSQYGLEVPQELIAKLANKIKLNTMMDIPGMGRKSARDLLSMLPANPAQSEYEQLMSPADMLAWESENSMLTGVPAADVLNYYGLLHYNALYIYDTKFCGVSGPIGLAVFPQASLRRMTPVCWDINVLLTFHGRRLFIHAAEDIPQYTGLRDLRYNEHPDPFCQTRAERRAAFEKKFGHPCTCRRCSPECDAEINPLRCVTEGCSNRIPSDIRAHHACFECGAINRDRLTQFHQFMLRYETITASSEMESYSAMVLQVCMDMDAAGILQPDAHFRYVCGRELPNKYYVECRLEEGLKTIVELVGCVTACVRKIYPEYSLIRARLLMSAGLSVVDALPKPMLNIGVDRMSSLDIQKHDVAAATVWALNMDFCSEARGILIKLFGKQSKEVQDGDADCKQAVTKLLCIQQMLRLRK
ncbi:uncharacterized protein LOC129591521 [Paramacrobiotus metropolitanus]|uniref:uncharacterized protein LOC129591521 n=1 Tax=Paramacrobiotus metropolitanus TaxID=2943436 RepID=UPI002445AE42|nr:uncharacterized protein LOC129591521 [Paramacrobiotus metropolitanus]